MATATSRRAPARRSRVRRTAAALAAVGVTTVLVAGCSSSGPDVISAGPAGSANPETPAADNPTTSVSSTSTSTSGANASTTTTDPDAAASTSTSTTTPAASATSVPPAVASASTPAAIPGVSSQVFWVRAPGDARVIDIPGYRDPDSGPLPLVLYGSVTNDGVDTVANPFVAAVWQDGGGPPEGVFLAPVLEPGSTTAMSVLAPGQSGDVIVVVTDADAAARLGALVPQLVVGSR